MTRLPVASERLHPISIDLYMAMGQAGLLTPRDRVVLIDGMLVNKMTKGMRHIDVVQAVVEALQALDPPGFYVRKEDPIALPGARPGDRDSVPEPDVVLVRGRRQDYARRLPGPADIALLVEVAESPLAEDRKLLVPYARAGVPIVWIVNLNTDTIEVYHTPMPDDPRYGGSALKRVGAQIEIEADGQALGTIAVSALLS